MTLTASACGNGLFTLGRVGHDGDANGDAADVIAPRPDGNVVDVVPPKPDGRVVDVVPPQPDGPVLPVFDASSDQQVLPDSAADAIGPGASRTGIIDSPGGQVPLGNATLVVPRNAFAQPTTVTLTLLSSDGTLAGYPGAIGPIFSLSKTDALGQPVTLQKPATFELNFTPADTSIPAARVALAYWDTQSNPNLWIAIVGSSYDPGAGVVTGSVFEFAGTRLFAPVESCLTGQTCPDPKACAGGACQ